MVKIGDVIDGKYTVVSKVGSGGMSNVYLARNEVANKNWALKESKSFPDNPKKQMAAKQSLIAEANTLKKLKHRFLPSVVDIYEDDGILIVMDYIEGRTLAQHLSENKTIPESVIIQWGLELCEVLGYLHSQNPPIIYRDMKPENVMIRTNSDDIGDGHICLIDFGISREFVEGKRNDTTLLGTRGYASPEQTSKNVQTDARSDIYSLGATLYHLVTRHDPCEPPFMEKSILEYNPFLSVGLDNIIRKCIAINPDDRYQSCAELHYALSHYNEQDKAYHSRMVKRLVGTGVLAGLFIVSSVTCGYSYSMEQKLRGSTYSAYIEDAVINSDEFDRFASYEKAINLEPANPEGYQKILDSIMEDGVLVASEDTYLRNLFSKEVEGKTLEEYFSANQKEYSDFAYDLAMAYWYSYGSYNENNEFVSAREYQLACRWFAKVAQYDDTEECKRKYDTATIYGKIGEYYAQIGVINMAGDNEIKYSDYLNDLIDVFDIKCSNVYTRLYLDKDILSQIIEHSVDYKAEGIEKEKLDSLIENVSNEVNALKVDDNSDYYTQILGDAVASVELARTSLDNAYSYTGGDNP